jgi:hypothetical protein
MKNLTILYSQFKKELERSPHIKIIDNRSQFDPPSESHKRTGLAELKDEGFETDEWLAAVIGLTKGNSINYHVIRDRQNRGEGSFSFNNPQDFLIEPEPWVAKHGTTDADRALLKQVRVIDQPGVAQAFTGVVMDSDSPPLLPQRLVYFRRGHLLPMELEFKDYYETLAAFMGVMDWQLLYTSAEPRTPGLRQCFDQLLECYETFCTLFPDRDFSLWGELLRTKKLIP